MHRLDFQSIDLKQLKNQYLSLSNMDIKENIQAMTPEQIAVLIELFGQEPGASGGAKLVAALAGLKENSSLELVGRTITAQQFLTILASKNQIEASPFRKIPPLLVGMNFQIFLEVLLEIPKELLLAIQDEGNTEPLQHQLTLLCHELSQQLKHLFDNLLHLENQLDKIDTRKINHDLLLSTHHAIKEWEIFANKNLIRIQNALSIAWNTTRTDLVETLSFQKEAWVKYAALAIGRQREYGQPASGLYARFESRLNTIFSNSEDPADIEALQDNEPALEALVKFSLWYLHDYWEIGLLPEIAHPSQLDLDPISHSDKERAEYRTTLLQEAQLNLERVGLKNVGDFKTKAIYSKEMLQDYLKKSVIGIPVK